MAVLVTLESSSSVITLVYTLGNTSLTDSLTTHAMHLGLLAVDSQRNSSGDVSR